MTIDVPRFATFRSLTEQGLSAEDAGIVVMAMHPLDDSPQPSREFERQARARAQRFAQSTRSNSLDAKVNEARKILAEHRADAFTFGDMYYQTRYDQYLGDSATESDLSSFEANPPLSTDTNPHASAPPPQGGAWWDSRNDLSAPTSPPPPPSTPSGANYDWQSTVQRAQRDLEQSGRVGGAAAQTGHAAPPRSLPEAISTCFKNYAVFEGRASRSEFWWFWLATQISVWLVPEILWSFGVISGDSAGFLLLSLFLGTVLPLLAVGARRMHDTGRSGWFLLIPLVNLVMLLTEGQPHRNRFG